MKPEQIEVVVHPQSIVHSMVQFTDGCVKAQLGVPDMRLPIQYALTFPERTTADFGRLDFKVCHSLTFEQPDEKTFRNLGLAYEAMRQGGNLPCILNAANEVCCGCLPARAPVFHRYVRSDRKNNATSRFPEETDFGGLYGNRSPDP